MPRLPVGHLPPLQSGGVGQPKKVADRGKRAAPEVPCEAPNRERSERFVVGWLGFGVPGCVLDRERSERLDPGSDPRGRARRKRSERLVREWFGFFRQWIEHCSGLGFRERTDCERSEQSVREPAGFPAGLKTHGHADRERSERSALGWLG